MKYVIAGIGGLVFVALTLIAFSLLGGWVISWLWLWFLVPLGLSQIGIAHSIGIAAIVGLLTKQRIKNGEGEYGEEVAFSILFPLMALLIGYVAHLYM